MSVFFAKFAEHVAIVDQRWANPNRDLDLNHDLNTVFDSIWSTLKYKDSIQKIAIWSEIFAIRFEKDLKGGAIVRVLLSAQTVEVLLLRMQFNVETALYWLADWLNYTYAVTVRSICVTVPKI